MPPLNDSLDLTRGAPTRLVGQWWFWLLLAVPFMGVLFNGWQQSRLNANNFPKQSEVNQTALQHLDTALREWMADASTTRFYTTVLPLLRQQQQVNDSETLRALIQQCEMGLYAPATTAPSPESIYRQAVEVVRQSVAV